MIATMRVFLITLCLFVVCAFAEEVELDFDEDDFLDKSNPLVIPKLKLIKQCQEVRAKCVKSGRRDCTLRYAICVAGSLVMCGKQCLMPYFMCIKDTKGSADEKIQQCTVNLITCLDAHCEKTPALTTNDNTIMEECQSLFHDCSEAASGIIQRGQCLVQLGICMAAKAVDCGKDCVPPMLLCKAKGLGSFTKIIQCNVEFVKCLVTSCAKPTTSLATSDNTIMEECKGLYDDCTNAASGIIQRGQCLVQFGLCMAAKAVDCGKDCVPPMLLCKAKGLGDFTKIIQCNIEFVKCIVTSCGKPATSLTASENTIMEECKGLLDDCMNAASGIIQRGQCLVQFGLCMAAKAVDCGKDCVPPMLLCKAKGLGDFTKIIQCNVEFVKCIVTSCAKPNNSLATTDNTIMEECKGLLDDCMNAASGIIQRGQCLVQFGLCMAAKAVDCGKNCVPPMLLCKAKGLGDFTKIIQCNIEFVKCIVTSCAKPTNSLATTDNTIMEECKGLYDDCTNAASGIIQRGQCLVQFGLCMAAKAVDCGKDCVPPMLLCKAKGLGSFTKIIQCNVEFVKCIVTSCAKPNNSLATTDNTIMEECKGLYDDCTNAASGIIQRGECLVQFGLCMAAKAVDCGKDCVPPMLLCKAKGLGSFTKIIQCNVEFVKCIVTSCAKPNNSLATTDNTIMEECKGLYDDCTNAASGIIQRGECLVQFGLCMAAKAVDCGKDCVPPMLLCKAKGLGSFTKIIQCNVEFVKCIVTSCAKPNNSLATTDNTIIEECKGLYDDCTNAASGIIQRGQCLVQFGLCMAAKAVDCGKDCVPPMLLCKAKGLGSFTKIIQCNIDFVECIATSCSKPAQSNETATSLSSESNGVIKTFGDICTSLYDVCHKLAFTPLQKLICFNLHMTCKGIKAVDCGLDCVPTFIKCKLVSIGRIIATFECYKTAIQCAIASCKGPPDSLPLIEPPVMEEIDESNSIVAECKAVLTDCLSKSDSLQEKAHCFTHDLKECLKKEAAGCAKSCLMPFAMCQMAGGLNWPALIKCGKQFLACSVAACMKNEPINMASLPLDNEMSPYEHAIQAVDDNSVSFTRCKNEFYTCIKTPGTGIKGKIQCFTQLGKCIGGELVGCSAHCIPQFALCKYEAKGSWIKTAVCAVKFLTCAKEGCINE